MEKMERLWGPTHSKNVIHPDRKMGPQEAGGWRDLHLGAPSIPAWRCQLPTKLPLGSHQAPWLRTQALGPPWTCYWSEVA